MIMKLTCIRCYLEIITAHFVIHLEKKRKKKSQCDTATSAPFQADSSMKN